MTYSRRQLLAAGAAAVPLLRVASRGGEPLALVTADKEAYVAVVGLWTARPRGRIPTLEGPRSIQSGPRGIAVVAHTTAGAVSIVDGRRREVRRVLRGFAEPRYTAVHPGGRWAFVTDSRAGEVAVVDLVRERVVARAAVGEHARHVTLDPAGRALWVGLGSSAAQLAVVDVADPLRPAVARRVRPPFLAHDVGFSPSGRRVWVTAGREPRLAVYTAAGRLVRELDADDAPQHVTFGPMLAYVASGEGASLRVHALADGRLVRSTHVPFGSYNVQRAHGRVLTPSLAQGTLTILDAHGGVLREVRVAAAAHDACAVGV